MFFTTVRDKFKKEIYNKINNVVGSNKRKYNFRKNIT